MTFEGNKPQSALTVDSFYENARKGVLLGLKCEQGHVTVPPRKTCHVCHSSELNQVKLSGRGIIQSYTEVAVKTKEFPIDTPYTLAMVRLEEGGNLIGVVRSQASRIGHGVPVSVRFEDPPNSKEKWPRIFFEFA